MCTELGKQPCGSTWNVNYHGDHVTTALHDATPLGTTRRARICWHLALELELVSAIIMRYIGSSINVMSAVGFSDALKDSYQHHLSSVSLNNSAEELQVVPDNGDQPVSH